MVVAIGVMGIVMMAAALGTTIAVKTARIAKERNLARSFVDRKFEEVRRERNEDPETFFAAGNWEETEQVGTSPLYTRVTTYTIEAAGERMLVLVTVTWVDAGVTRSVAQSTYLSRQQ